MSETSTRLVWSTDQTHLCEICEERDYGSPCDTCLDAILERCPHCNQTHSILAQLDCLADAQEGWPDDGLDPE